MQADLPDARYLVFGWGSRAFYIETPTWSDLKPGPLLSALTLDARSCMSTLPATIDEPQPAVAGFDVSEAEFERLLDFIDEQFPDTGRTGRSGSRTPATASSTASSKRTATSTRFVGCNTWTARALREAGLQTGWWNPLPQTLGCSLDLHN